MKRKLYFAFAFFGNFLICATLILISEKINRPYVDISKEIIKSKETQFSQGIAQYNDQSRNILTFSCEKARVSVYDNNNIFRLAARVFYSKDNKFRLLISSIFGLELDLGCNEDVFWFWSKRAKAPDKGLHFAKYENLSKTGLKNPFNPMWILQSFGFKEISLLSSTKLMENANYILVSKPDSSPLGENVTETSLIQKGTYKFKGLTLVDAKGNVIAESEIFYNEQGLPHRIVYDWVEEKKTMEIELRNPQFNAEIDESVWELPDITPKVEMGN